MMMDIQKPTTTKTLYAIETAVVDLHYAGGDDALKSDYFSSLPRLLSTANPKESMKEAPRPGDMRMIARQDFDKTLESFAKEKGLTGNPSLQIFGDFSAHAGGSLANTFDSMIHSRVEDQAIFDGVFETCVGSDGVAFAFEKPFEGHSSITSIQDPLFVKTMTSHIVPINGDRIMITTPNGDNDAQNFISPKTINAKAVKAADRVMIGGYLNFRAPYDAEQIYETIMRYAHEGQKDPHFVLTAAAQAVAEMNHVRKKFNLIACQFNTTIHANTGEFRRLLNADTDWRKHTSEEFKHLDGSELEAAKKEHANYQEMKRLANHLALQAGVHYCDVIHRDTGRELDYVVTNGAKEAYHVTRRGVVSVETPKVDKDKIISTVGAGDNHMAGFQLGVALGLSIKDCFAMANMFAAKIIQSPLARLDPNTSCNAFGMTCKEATVTNVSGPLAHVLKY